MTRAARSLPFFLPHALSAFAIARLFRGQSDSLQIVFYAFLVAPYLDALFGRDQAVPGGKSPNAIETSVWWRVAVCSWIPIQATLVVCALRAVRDLTPWDVLTTGICSGMLSGMFGVTAAHELMHRQGPVYRLGSLFLLLLIGYPHFLIEHVHGHHHNVSTRLDPATARIGEGLYRFLLRSLAGGLRSAWQIETRRLRAFPMAALYQNRMLRQYTALALFYAAIAAVVGAEGLLWMGAQSLVAIFLLETLNYVGHYGLVRRQIGAGLYEPVQPQHSWNSSHRFSNWLLFNVGRHSDHHCEPSRTCLSLRHKASAPQLPGGYFAMFVLSLFPPLWRRIMDPLAIAAAEVNPCEAVK